MSEIGPGPIPEISDFGPGPISEIADCGPGPFSLDKEHFPYLRKMDLGPFSLIKENGPGLKPGLKGFCYIMAGRPFSDRVHFP